MNGQPRVSLIRAGARWVRLPVLSAARQTGLLVLLAIGIGPAPAWAERYLTIAEAQKVCFPEADSFEAQIVRFTPEQAKAIEKLGRTRPLNKGNRIWLAYQGTNLLGVLVLDFVLAKHELIDYVVAIAPAGKVRQVEVLEFRESHGWEVRREAWRDQFKNKTADAPLRLNDDIYNISGATLSCRHLTEGVRRVLATFEVVVRPRLLSAGGMPHAGS